MKLVQFLILSIRFFSSFNFCLLQSKSAAALFLRTKQFVGIVSGVNVSGGFLFFTINSIPASIHVERCCCWNSPEKLTIGDVSSSLISHFLLISAINGDAHLDAVQIYHFLGWEEGRSCACRATVAPPRRLKRRKVGLLPFIRCTPRCILSHNLTCN